MSGGPIARWLETFVCNNMCKTYVETFKTYGYDTLNDICKLNGQQLLKMGVTKMDTEKILENVSVLRQTIQAGVPNTYQSNSGNNNNNNNNNYPISPKPTTIQKNVISPCLVTSKKLNLIY